MRESYLDYYRKPSLLAPLVLFKDALLAKSRVARISGFHRLRDYLELGKRPEQRALHHAIQEQLLAASRQWQSYDYGEGYFYQGLPEIGITGLRDTAGRVAQMKLAERCAGRTVLEIGCNSGFVAISIARRAERVVAFDVNPYHLEIGRLTAAHLGIDNIEFIESSFEDLDPSATFGAVLSFANHSTYDGNTRQSVQQFIERCCRHSAEDGLFVFESHPPAHEGDGLGEVCRLIDESFALEERRVLDYGSFLDRARTFSVSQRRPVSVA